MPALTAKARPMNSQRCQPPASFRKLKAIGTISCRLEISRTAIFVTVQDDDRSGQLAEYGHRLGVTEMFGDPLVFANNIRVGATHFAGA